MTKASPGLQCRLSKSRGDVFATQPAFRRFVPDDMQSIPSLYRGPGTVCHHRNAGPQPSAAFEAFNPNYIVYATKNPRFSVVIRNQLAARWTPSNGCIPHIRARNINAKNWPPRYNVQIVDPS